MLRSHLSERLQRLCREVLGRLPPDWDEHRTVVIEESLENPLRDGVIVYATSLGEEEPLPFPLEGVHQEVWMVMLYANHLTLLPDRMVKWVIAHELGHVCSGLRTGSIMMHGVPMTQVAPGIHESATDAVSHKDAATRRALEWGFHDEYQQWQGEEA